MLQAVEFTQEEHRSIILHALDVYVLELLRYQEFSQYFLAKQLALKEVLAFSEVTPDIFVYRLVDNDRDIGYLMFSIERSRQLSFLADIYIYSPYRGKGYAKQTMKLFEDFSLREQANHCLLYVFIKNERAVHLYHRCGYFVAGEYTLNEATEPTRYAMVKWLV